MLSKNQIRFINSLQIKKYRQLHQSFVVEGEKSVSELLNSDYEIEFIVMTPEFHRSEAVPFEIGNLPVYEAAESELTKMGSLQSNNTCLAVVKTKENSFLHADRGEFVLVLDDVRDPGNLGTIIRIADWYGIRKIVCSNSTTEFYNPKVIASAKGSFTRVSVFYTDLPDYFSKLPNLPVIGTFMEGSSLHDFDFPAGEVYLVMGNESNGISAGVARFISTKITIPRFGEAESLNVGVATALVCDAWRRGRTAF